MTGIRTCVGWGNLSRVSGEGVDELPTGTTPLNALSSLTKRFGGAVTFSSTESRNAALENDLGLREPTTQTQGITQGSFTVGGYFSTECIDWLAYAVHSDKVEITSASVFITKADSTEYQVSIASGTAGQIEDSEGAILNPQPSLSTVGYVKTGTTTSTLPITLGVFANYIVAINGGAMVVDVFGYKHLDTAKSFDIGQFQINSTAADGNGGNNMICVYTGCYIDTMSLQYENGGDAAVQFSINGYYLRKFYQVSSTVTDYANIIDDPPSKVLITGCMLKSDDSYTYNQIAYTDSSELDISNNLQAVPACGKITYGTYALANVSYDVKTQTYSVNPNNYIAALTGYESFSESTVYTDTKNPYVIPFLKIRSQDTDTGTAPTEFLDINLTDTISGSMDFSYDVGQTIMDSPDLTTKRAYIAVGYTPAS